jgi:hypothetical protein
MDYFQIVISFLIELKPFGKRKNLQIESINR